MRILSTPIAGLHQIEEEAHRDLRGLFLRTWCREHLGRHEVPRRLIIRAGLPKNAAGKILKRELRRSGEHERGIDTA